MGTHRLPIHDFLPIAINIAKILQELHEARAIHLDIKPHNILINPMTRALKLGDFSASHITSLNRPYINFEDCTVTTYKYMSPEQTGKFEKQIDFRSDIYSLGATFYFMLSAVPPFQSKDANELIHCHLTKEPPELDVPRPISKIIKAMMAKNVEERYQSCHG